MFCLTNVKLVSPSVFTYIRTMPVNLDYVNLTLLGNIFSTIDIGLTGSFNPYLNLLHLPSLHFSPPPLHYALEPPPFPIL